MQQSAMEAPAPSIATEIGMGGIETVSMRSDNIPVRHMFAPPSTIDEKGWSVPYLSARINYVVCVHLFALPASFDASG